MRKITNSIFIAMILTLLASPVFAVRRVSDDTSYLRQTAIVDAQRQDNRESALRAFVIETMAVGDYTAHYQADGQSVGHDHRNVNHLLAWLPNRRGGVSVAVVGNAATCRIFDSTGRLLSEVRGGNTAFCSVVP